MAKKCAVILAKCQKTKENFGIRMENQVKKMDNRDVSLWTATWTYKIKSDADAQNSGASSQLNLEGDLFLVADNYPGCPYCKNSKLIQCAECSRTFCASADQNTVVCPWDNKTLGGDRGSVKSVRAGNDR
jgi:hypothetical protein